MWIPVAASLEPVKRVTAMYEGYFGLASNPFGMTPDPDFLYQSPSHREALAALTYGVQLRRGFMTLVGEVGTGKTTLVNTLIASLERSTRVIVVTHTTVDREELLWIIVDRMYRLEPFGRRSGAAHGSDQTSEWLSRMSRIELINQFSAFVNGEVTAYRPPPLLVIDEAQNLTPQVLEEIRLLTNLEGAKSKLVQVLLSGQPELDALLARNDLRQLQQRIAVWARLQPLTCDETVEYVRHRLNRAGADGQQIFTPDAVQAIWAASGGVPRTVNVICDYALINALASGVREVTWALADDAIQDVLGFGVVPPHAETEADNRWLDEPSPDATPSARQVTDVAHLSKPKSYVLTRPGNQQSEEGPRDVAAGGGKAGSNE
jgi:general secretion pathway protein A